MAEKIFEHHLELPINARTEVIDQMEPDERVRFTRCSILCSKEVQASKNYFRGFMVFCRGSEYMAIIVATKKVEVREHGFQLTIARENNRKFKTYRSLNDHGRTWKDELDSSTNLIQYAIEELKYRLKIYQGSIKFLRIHDDPPMLTNVDLGIRNLSNLELLEMCCSHFHVSQILSKLQKPLKELCFYGTNNTSLSSNHKQVYQVQNKIDWENANFNIEQIQRLTAKNVETDIGQLTEKNIFKFIRFWQDGTIGKEIESYEWSLKKSKFKKKKLLRLLRVPNREQRKIEIKHYYEAGKRAILMVNRFSLKFSTILGDFDRVDSDSSEFSNSSDSDSDSDF